MPFYASWEEAVPNQSVLKSHAFITSAYRASEERNKNDILALPVADQDAVDTLLDTLTSVSANIEAIVNSRVDDSLINEIRRRPLGPPPGVPAGAAPRVAAPLPVRRPLGPAGPDLPPAGRAGPRDRDWFGREIPEEKEEEDEGVSESRPFDRILREASRGELSGPSAFSRVSARAVTEGSRTQPAFTPVFSPPLPRTRQRPDPWDLDEGELVPIARRAEEEETIIEPYRGTPPGRGSPALARAVTLPYSPSPAERGEPKNPYAPSFGAVQVVPARTVDDYVQVLRGYSIPQLNKEAVALGKVGYEAAPLPPKERTEENVNVLLAQVAAASLDADRRYLEANQEVRPFSVFSEDKPRRVVKAKSSSRAKGLAVQSPRERSYVEGEGIEGAGMSGGAQASALPTSAKVGTLIDRALRMIKKMDFRIIPAAELGEIKAVADRIREMVIVPGADPALANIQAKVMALLTQLDVKLATHGSLIQVKEGAGFGYMPGRYVSEFIGPVMEDMPRRYM